MDINLRCEACGNHQILAAEVPEDKMFCQVEHEYFDDDKSAKITCDECGSKQLYYYVDENKIPGAMGGTKNYMSMERYWAHNKGEFRRHEDKLSKTMAERHQDRVASRINKQTTRQGKEKRHDGYNNGNSEQRLSSD